MKLTLARHGQTIENVNGIVQGQIDGTLTDMGKAQAQELAERLKDVHFDQIFSSDLKRCTDTAAYILRYHQKTQFTETENLREISFGAYQGRPAAEIDWGTIEGSFINRKPGGGESIQEAGKRVINFTNAVLADNQDKNVLFITHGGPMRLIKAEVEELSVKELEELFKSVVDNGGTWEFDINAPLNFLHS
jgi:broad specificity phosphatase PhoE